MKASQTTKLHQVSDGQKSVFNGFKQQTDNPYKRRTVKESFILN